MPLRVPTGACRGSCGFSHVPTHFPASPAPETRAATLQAPLPRGPGPAGKVSAPWAQRYLRGPCTAMSPPCTERGPRVPSAQCGRGSAKGESVSSLPIRGPRSQEVGCSEPQQEVLQLQTLSRHLQGGLSPRGRNGARLSLSDSGGQAAPGRGLGTGRGVSLLRVSGPVSSGASER